MYRHATPPLIDALSRANIFVAMLTCALLAGLAGCAKEDPIITYKISTKVPEQLKPGKERMLVAMMPRGEKVWFFKVMSAPENAVESIKTPFRDFVESVKFESGSPVLSELPNGWRRGGEKRMRYASIDVTTPGKQLDISISNLPRPPGSESDDAWNQYVLLNVNRWRRQVGLDPSSAKWGGGQPIQLASSDGQSIWLDISGDPADANNAMGGMGAMGPAMGQTGGPFSGAPFSGGSPPSSSNASSKKPFNPRLKFDRPDGWRDGRMSSMRWAAFNVGGEDSQSDDAATKDPDAKDPKAKNLQAEVTVMPAGGDLRGNVQRWIGQVIGGQPDDAVVDKALEDATKLKVSGRDAQRFVLTGNDPDKGTAIDATIVPMEGGVNMFIKMTGPAQTVSEQNKALEAFLKSLEF